MEAGNRRPQGPAPHGLGRGRRAAERRGIRPDRRGRPVLKIPSNAGVRAAATRRVQQTVFDPGAGDLEGDGPRPLVAIVVLNRRPVGGSSGQARPTAPDGLRPCPECGRSPLDDVSLG